MLVAAGLSIGLVSNVITQQRRLCLHARLRRITLLWYRWVEERAGNFVYSVLLQHLCSWRCESGIFGCKTITQEIATLGRNITLSNGTVVKSTPDIYILIPPPLMKQGAYDMNQTIINTVLPQLIPLIGDANSDVVKGVIDVYHGMGGTVATALR